MGEGYLMENPWMKSNGQMDIQKELSYYYLLK